MGRGLASTWSLLQCMIMLEQRGNGILQMWGGPGPFLSIKILSETQQKDEKRWFDSKRIVTDFKRKRWKLCGLVMTCVLSAFVYSSDHDLVAFFSFKRRSFVKISKSLVSYLNRKKDACLQYSGTAYVRTDDKKCHHVASHWWPANPCFCPPDKKTSPCKLPFLFRCQILFQPN